MLTLGDSPISVQFETQYKHFFIITKMYNMYNNIFFYQIMRDLIPYKLAKLKQKSSSLEQVYL